MNKRRRRALYTGLIIAGVLALLIVLLVPLVWFSPAFSARVVDASSGHPVDGARVTISWELSDALFDYPLRRLATVKVVTDADGRFHVRAWGPRFHFGWAMVSGNQPVIKVAHPDYELWEESNSQFAGTPNKGPWGLLIIPAVRDQSIELEPVSKEARE